MLTCDGCRYNSLGHAQLCVRDAAVQVSSALFVRVYIALSLSSWFSGKFHSLNVVNCISHLHVTHHASHVTRHTSRITHHSQPPHTPSRYLQLCCHGRRRVTGLQCCSTRSIGCCLLLLLLQTIGCCLLLLLLQTMPAGC